ncbi:MAG: biopolymer transporter ExbD [Saprospiraceae bacterium]|nr:biopolymer transporter ExbD [Saprospiraceae bacterium]
MAIKTRNKRSAEFNTSSMSDLVFLLLIFFMLLSTLISPNAINLNLPKSSSTIAPVQAKVAVSIDEQYQFAVDNIPVLSEDLYGVLNQKLAGQTEASVDLSVSFDVPIQYIVDVIDAVNKINKLNNTKNKVILKTDPK